jgi:hypothetical protein
LANFFEDLARDHEVKEKGIRNKYEEGKIKY